MDVIATKKYKYNEDEFKKKLAIPNDEKIIGVSKTFLGKTAITVKTVKSYK